MHYLVTGGCGFIGSHLVDRLLAAGHAVTVIDDLSNGRRDNIPAAAGFIGASVAAPGVFDGIIAHMDGCFHLAAIASVQKSTEEWLATHRVNLGGTVALLDALARAGRKIPVVFASSAAVYGDGGDAPLTESGSCVPLTAYGADKLAGELHAYTAHRVHGIPAFSLRFFNAYGPRQNPDSPYSGVISVFAARMRKAQPLTIFGDGRQTRDLIYVADIIDGLTLAMRALEEKRLAHGVCNICTGRETSILELAETMAAVGEVAPAITHAPARPGDIRLSLGDPMLAQKLLGFAAQIPLKEGLKRLLSYSPI